jgi:hypothetical protein
MSFTKAVFLTSLTCFTLGVGSGFADCTNIVTTSDSDSGGCDFSSAVNYVNKNTSVDTITFTESYNFTADSTAFSTPTSIDILANSSEFALTSDSNIAMMTVSEGSTVTVGPSSSVDEILFSAGTGVITVNEGALVFGPMVRIAGNTIMPTINLLTGANPAVFSSSIGVSGDP